MKSGARGWGLAQRAGRTRNAGVLLFCLVMSRPASAQDPHAGMSHDAAGSGWTFMQDANVFLMFNHQGSPRG